ncbi:tryptophanyl-tRNA synthetase [Rhodothermus marinus SG0.5JP17-172]|uniref:tryptophan--tRNA ligase n=1 Tax=Rhodothermus marinus TaxID=29549 RepID=UPI000223DD58|nr:tryptophan--tRNA ligase [Rhodothermus marinus]AEN73745.1 tryptophanyl-tRNA synthetase [Rhodothermus marinus SG0.5JP17-172]
MSTATTATAPQTTQPTGAATRTIVVSGIQPSGELHLGNYFGAIRQHLELHERYESYFFIVNYHALTTIHDREALRRYTFEAAVTYLALGFNPEKAALFVQSDVPEVTELAWIFYNLVPVSTLEKGVAYKDKVAQGLPANAGLFNYPVLQAADILIYGGTLVPVGADQKQNIEICRDIAQRFNRTFCPPDRPLFPIPEPLIREEVAVVPGIDGRKMSKSYGNTIGIFDEGKTLRKKVMSIVTDSTPLEAPKDPDRCNVFALIKLFADEETRNRIAEAYRRGGYGYGDAKKELIRLIDEHFAEARERRRELLKHPDYVIDVLREGARKGRRRAQEMMEQVRDLVGLNYATYRPEAS